MPKVSILCSVYNGDPFLEECLESVINQSFQDFELIIVDDMSVDATEKILDQYARRDHRIRVLRNQTRRGLTRNLNLALQEAKGEYLARLDADDLMAPERLAQQVAYLDSHPQCSLLGSAAGLIDEKGNPIGQWQGGQDATLLRWKAISANPLTHGSVMMRHSFLLQHHLAYNESFEVSQDYELWLRILPLTEAFCLSDPLYILRCHASSVSALRRRQQKKNTYRALSSYMLNEYGVSLSYREFLLWRGCVLGDRQILSRQGKIKYTKEALRIQALFFHAFIRRYGLSLPVLADYLKGAIVPLLRPLRYGHIGVFWKAVVCFTATSIRGPK